MADVAAKDLGPARRGLVNIRISERDRTLIDRAAELRGTNRSEFMLAAARKAAEEAILDRAFLVVDADRFSAFAALLDEPPEPSEGLKKLLATRPIWDE